MIESGEKLEEYRDITPYYGVRFRNVPKFPYKGKEYFYVILRRGYRKNSPIIVIACWLDKGTGETRWGAEPGKEYYRLHITAVQKPIRLEVEE